MFFSPMDITVLWQHQAILGYKTHDPRVLLSLPSGDQTWQWKIIRRFTEASLKKTVKML